MTYQTLKGIGPGIDISHYGAPYKQMLGVEGLGAYTEQPGMDYEYATAGLGEMLYRYGAGLGVEPWTGPPAEDPRMVKRYTTIEAKWQVQGIPSDKAAEIAQRLRYQGRQQFSGNRVEYLGSNGWVGGGWVGYKITLAAPMRAGEIKQKNYQAGVAAARGMVANGTPSARLINGRTSIPSNAFEGVASDAATSSTAETSTEAGETTLVPSTSTAASSSSMPPWAVPALVGVGALGLVGVVVLVTRKKQAVAANRRRRRSSRRRR